jgi:hypothetical protein
MWGRLFDQRLRLYLVGGVLCLLATAFAIEAKLAWYSPASSLAAQIGATKLQPADAPKLIAQALSAPLAQHHFPAEPIFVLAVAMLAAVIPLAFDGWGRDELKLQVPLRFSPNLFRRPPPQL